MLRGFCIGCNAVVRSDKRLLALHEHKGSGQARGQRWRINADQCSFLYGPSLTAAGCHVSHLKQQQCPLLAGTDLPPMKNYDKLFFSGHPFYWLIRPLPRGKKSFFLLVKFDLPSLAISRLAGWHQGLNHCHFWLVIHIQSFHECSTFSVR